MIKLSELKEYSGTDASKEISLYEYGLLCVEQHEEELHCYYGVGCDDEGNYNMFCSGSITKPEIDSMINENWFHKHVFFSFLGMEEKNWLSSDSYISKLSDLLSYYGFENIMGSNYEEPFEILNE
jgi:hypothetical protein